MGFSDIFARIVALVGGVTILVRRPGATRVPAWGSAPEIPPAKSQGGIPTLKMPTAR